ncbi:hypothetical protein P879_03440 [Paragonimus westermani]|uniref:G-protein coupled receptors family 1 profile domain-containing protein n=1 Tax=Paragonimus westermani TaxID=34504 RepID=A0A8T0DNZ9_9TREM|nr:hypothetical protein P879_03440 [Paragonimus westermani]
MANIHRPLWAVVYYLLPLIFLIAVNFRVIWHIRTYYRTHRTSVAPLPELPTTIANQNACDPYDDQEVMQSRSTIKSLTVGTLTLIVTMILAHSYDSGYYVFGPSLGYAYIVGSNEQLISLLITSINCLTNPVILALSLPTMRTFLFAQYSWFCVTGANSKSGRDHRNAEVGPEFHVVLIAANLHRPFWAWIYCLLPPVILVTVNFRVVWHIRAYFHLRGLFTGPKQTLPTLTATETSGSSDYSLATMQSRSTILSHTVGTLVF